jgi:transcriptional regulator with XRE-family HTH domain
MSSHIAKRLREARLNAGLSQEKLGVLAGIDEMSASARMNQYEREKHVPDTSMIERIAMVLNLPATYFYAEHDIEADLLCRFHRLKARDKKRILEFIGEIESNS